MKPPGLKRAHLRVPAFTKTTKIQREDPQERERRMKTVAGEGKKKEPNFRRVRGRGPKILNTPTTHTNNRQQQQQQQQAPENLAKTQKHKNWPNADMTHCTDGVSIPSQFQDRDHNRCFARSYHWHWLSWRCTRCDTVLHWGTQCGPTGTGILDSLASHFQSLSPQSQISPLGGW